MTQEFDDGEFMSGAEINQILVAHAFRNAGIASDNTAEQDLNSIKAYTINAYRASITHEPAPLVTEELVAAAQRTRIRATARGEDFVLFFALKDIVDAQEQSFAQRTEAATDCRYADFIEGLMRPPRL